MAFSEVAADHLVVVLAAAVLSEAEEALAEVALVEDSKNAKKRAKHLFSSLFLIVVTHVI